MTPSLTTPQAVKDAADLIASALCKADGTGQCAAICLSHSSLHTKPGECPERKAVWGYKAKVVAAALPIAPDRDEKIRKAVKVVKWIRDESASHEEALNASAHAFSILTELTGGKKP